MSTFISTNFDAVEDTGAGSFAFPAGTHTVIVVGDNDKKTKSGGRMLGLQLEGCDAPFKGKRTWINLVYAYDNGTPQKDGKTLLGFFLLKRLAIACGVDASRGLDVAQLYNKPVAVQLAVSKDLNDNDRNELKGVPDFDKTPGALRLAQKPGAPVRVAAPPPPAPAAAATPSAGIPAPF